MILENVIKKGILVSMTIGLLLSVEVSAAETPKANVEAPKANVEAPKTYLRYNSKLITMENEPEPFINADGRIMVPIRFAADQLKATTSWDQNTKTVSVNKGDKKIKLVLGQKSANVDGKAVELDTSAVMVKSRLFVPARFISENFGAFVGWSSLYKTVSIYKPSSITINEMTRLRSHPAEFGASKKDAPKHTFEDSNVWCYLPSPKSLYPSLRTADGRYEDNLAYMNIAALGVKTFYSFDYKKAEEYKKNIYDLMNDANVNINVGGKELKTSEWIDNFVKEYTDKKVVSEAQFRSHPSLIYLNKLGHTAIRGIIRYKINEGPTGWWYNDKAVHKIGMWYERDVEVVVYNSVDGGNRAKKVLNFRFLTAPRLSTALPKPPTPTPSITPSPSSTR